MKNKKKEKQKVFYYTEVTQDFMETKKQNYVLPDDYDYMPKGVWFKIKSAVIYFVAKIFARLHAVFGLHLKIVNRKVVKNIEKTGYFIYGNHSNPLSDVFTPALVADRRIYTVCSPANFGIPIIGNILTEIGGIPLGKDEVQKKKFRKTIDTRIEEGKVVVIYPEAHLWPYYVDVRDFPNKSFKYPAELDVPVIAMTTTYQKRRFGKKPRATVYVDGPFYPDPKLSDEENREKLKTEVYTAMKQRVKNTTYEYYKYVPIEVKKEVKKK